MKTILEKLEQAVSEWEWVENSDEAFCTAESIVLGMKYMVLYPDFSHKILAIDHIELGCGCGDWATCPLEHREAEEEEREVVLQLLKTQDE